MSTLLQDTYMCQIYLHREQLDRLIEIQELLRLDTMSDTVGLAVDAALKQIKKDMGSIS